MAAKTVDKVPELGDEAKDIVTGFSGVVASIHTFLHGCTRISIEPTTLDKDGKPIEAHTFDIQRIQVTKAKPVPMATHTAHTPFSSGGPNRAETRSSRSIR